MRWPGRVWFRLCRELPVRAAVQELQRGRDLRLLRTDQLCRQALHGLEWLRGNMWVRHRQLQGQRHLLLCELRRQEVRRFRWLRWQVHRLCSGRALRRDCNDCGVLPSVVRWKTLRRLEWLRGFLQLRRGRSVHQRNVLHAQLQREGLWSFQRLRRNLFRQLSDRPDVFCKQHLHGERLFADVCLREGVP